MPFLLFNKPFGIVTQFSGDNANLSNHIKIKSIYPAGRLDKKSEGLILLTNDGINNVEKIFSNAGILKNNNFYDPENLSLVHHVNQALRANHLFQKGKDYIIQNDELKISTVFLSPEIYIPIIAFFVIFVIAFAIRKFYFKQ